MALNFLNNGYFAGNVGIKVLSPSYDLDVSGTIAIDSIAFATTTTSGGNTGSDGVIKIGDTDGNAYELALYDQSTSEVVRVASQKVGIGTTSPAAKLDIISSGLGTMLRLSNTEANATTKYGAVLGRHYFNSEENITGMLITSSVSTTGGRVSIGGGISAANAVNDILFYTAANNTTLTGSERMRIDASGNVGIGHSDPFHKLSIEGGGDTTALLKLRQTTNGNGAAIEFNDNGTSAGTQNGTITYYHSDSSSQGGGSSYWLRGQDDQTLVLANNGRVVVQKSGSTTEVGYGFYDDINTGMYRIAADNLGFATAGVKRLDINGSSATFSGNLTISGGNITLAGTGRIQGIDTVSATTDAANKAYVDAAVAGVPTGDITGVTAGTFLTGGGTSGTVTLNADTSKLGHIVNSSNGSVTAGWITVAIASSARRQGEVYVTDGESGDHAFIRIDWLRSYADTNFTVLNCGGHSNRIVGVRVLQQTSDTTYGPKYLQIKVTATSNYYVAVVAPGTIPNYTDLFAVTPVLENTKTGYAVTGAQLEDLDDSSVGTHEGLTVGEDLYVNGGGVVLGGTGRIQGVDTVSAGTDAVNKTYVDTNFPAKRDLENASVWFNVPGIATTLSPRNDGYWSASNRNIRYTTFQANFDNLTLELGYTYYLVISRYKKGGPDGSRSSDRTSNYKIPTAGHAEAPYAVRPTKIQITSLVQNFDFRPDLYYTGTSSYPFPRPSGYKANAAFTANTSRQNFAFRIQRINNTTNAVELSKIVGRLGLLGDRSGGVNPAHVQWKTYQ